MISLYSRSIEYAPHVKLLKLIIEFVIVFNWGHDILCREYVAQLSKSFNTRLLSLRMYHHILSIKGVINDYTFNMRVFRAYLGDSFFIKYILIIFLSKMNIFSHLTEI